MKDTKKLIITGLFAAFICVLTMFPKFPLANGYIHLGDSLIIVSAFLIGIYSIPAAAIGSLLADVISGYAIYAPATFIIKGLMAFVVYIIISKRDNFLTIIIASVIAEIIMMAGYFLYETVLYGYSVAIVNIPFGLIQSAGGIVIAIMLIIVIKRFNLKTKLLK